MAVNVQHLSGAMAAGETTDDVTISSVDTSKAFIIASVVGENTDVERCKVTAEFTTATNVRLTRGESGTAVDIFFQVIEQTNGEFEVQTGTISITSGGTTLNGTISDVGDTGQCSVFYGVSMATSDDVTQQLFRCQLTTTTNLQVVRGTSGSTGTLRYYVVKWHSSVTVYPITHTNSSGATSVSIGGTVTLSRTALFMTWYADTNGLAQASPLGYLDTTTLYVTRETSTGNCLIQAWVVEFPAAVAVQSNNDNTTTSLGSAVTTTTANLSAVTEANTMVVFTNMCTGTGTAFNRQALASSLASDVITFRCDYTGQTRDINWYAIDFAAWSLADTYSQASSVKANLVPAEKNYTRSYSSSLPSNDDNLSTIYSAAEITDVDTSDDTRVGQEGSGYVLHLYKRKHTNNTDAITVNWEGQTDTAPSTSTVYLQIYNRTSTSWETLDSDNSSSASTDFTLSGTKSSSLTDYYDGTYYVISVRVYQLNTN